MKKIYTLFLLTTISIGALHAQLSGAFTVGGSSSDYATIQAACDDLALQGISGAVTLNIRDGVYPELVDLDTVLGVSAANTITFQAETTNSSGVSITGTGTLFNSAVGYLSFIDLNFDQAGVDQNTLVVNDGNNVQIKRCAFNQATPSTSTGSAVTLNNDSTDVANILIDSSSVTNHYNGADIQGDHISAITVNQFEVSDAANRALSIESQENMVDIHLSYLAFDSVRTGAYLEVEDNGYMKRCQLTNSTINSTGNDGFYAYTHGLSIDSILIEDCVFRSGDNTFGGKGIEIEAGDADLKRVEIRSVSVSDFNDGISLQADVLLQDVIMDDLNVDVLDEGIYLEGDEFAILNVSLINSTVKSETDDAVYMESNYTIDNVTVRNDSLISNGQDGLYLDAGYSMLSNIDVRNNYLMADTAGTGFDYALYLEAADGEVKNILVKNNELLGHYGVHVYAYLGMENVELDSLTAHATYRYGVYLEKGYGSGENIRLTNSVIVSDDNYGVYFDNDYDDYVNVWFENLTINADDEGIYFDGDDGGLADFTLINSSITSTNSYGFYYEGYYTACHDIHIADNIINSRYESIYMEHDYGDMYNILIENNELNSADDEGIYLEADDGELRDVVIKNNELETAEAIYLEGDYGGANNIAIDSNLFVTNGQNNTAIEIDDAGSDISITNNQFSALYDTSYWRYGMEIDGDDNSTFNLLIQNNQIDSVRDGMYIEYVGSALIDGNTIRPVAGFFNEGIYFEYCYSGPIDISNNTIIGTGSGYGIEMEYIYTFSNPNTIKNNFLSNTGQAFYIDEVSNLTIGNNSMFQDTVTDALAQLTDNNNLALVNNIFQTNVSIFNPFSESYMVEVDNFDQFSMLDYNSFNYDTAGASLAYEYTSGGIEYKTLADFQAATNLGQNSLLRDVTFINEPTDLHVNCTESALKAGIAVEGITDDIDGQLRATTPTIGADEIIDLDTYDLFADDEIVECFTSYLLDASFIPGATYDWSTGASTQTISVTDADTYFVTVTDPCGQSATDTIVLKKPLPEADFIYETSFLTATFTNTSTNAMSYTWDFGDSTSSTMMSPVHIYDEDSVFEVILTAENDCGTTTTTQSITISIPTGINDIFLDGQVSAYPNPSAGLVNIAIEDYDLNEGLSINVFTTVGQLIYSTPVINEITTIDLNNYEAGIYIIRIEDGVNAMNLKAVIK